LLKRLSEKQTQLVVINRGENQRNGVTKNKEKD